MKNILISIIAVFMTLGCSSNEYEEAAWNVVKKFNNNTTELTSFLEYYKSLFKFCLVTFLSPPVSPFPQLNRT